MERFEETLSRISQAGPLLEPLLEAAPLQKESQSWIERMRQIEIVALNHRAWRFATSTEESERDGARAVEEATRACELTEFKNHGCLDTLAAAHAEVGDFEAAVKRQKQAIELAPEEDRAEFEAHLELYENKTPYRE